MQDIKILKDNRHFTVIQYQDNILCYSYKKLICSYNRVNNECKVNHKNIETDANRKHLALFVKMLS